MSMERSMDMPPVVGQPPALEIPREPLILNDVNPPTGFGMVHREESSESLSSSKSNSSKSSKNQASKVNPLPTRLSDELSNLINMSHGGKFEEDTFNRQLNMVKQKFQGQPQDFFNRPTGVLGSPLHIASQSDLCIELAKFFVENGADVNANGPMSYPLIIAVRNGCEKITEYLLQHGADPNVRAKTGETAYRIASQMKYTNIANLLQRHGAHLQTNPQVEMVHNNEVNKHQVSTSNGNALVSKMIAEHSQMDIEPKPLVDQAKKNPTGEESEYEPSDTDDTAESSNDETDDFLIVASKSPTAMNQNIPTMVLPPKSSSTSPPSGVKKAHGSKAKLSSSGASQGASDYENQARGWNTEQFRHYFMSAFNEIYDYNVNALGDSSFKITAFYWFIKDYHQTVQHKTFNVPDKFRYPTKLNNQDIPADEKSNKGKLNVLYYGFAAQFQQLFLERALIDRWCKFRFTDLFLSEPCRNGFETALDEWIAQHKEKFSIGGEDDFQTPAPASTSESKSAPITRSSSQPLTMELRPKSAKKAKRDRDYSNEYYDEGWEQATKVNEEYVPWSENNNNNNTPTAQTPVQPRAPVSVFSPRASGYEYVAAPKVVQLGAPTITSDFVDQPLGQFARPLCFEPGQITLGNIIGKVATAGKVTEGEWNGVAVAVKTFHMAIPSTKLLEEEFAKICALRHPNVVQVYGYLKDPVSVVMERVTHGSLHNLIMDRGIPSIETKLKIAVDVAAAMDYLHSRGVLHKDLKSSNVLITFTVDHRTGNFGLQAKVSDIGLLGLEEHRPLRGGVAYISPEVWGGAPPSTQSDVWSFGRILIHMFCPPGTEKPFDWGSTQAKIDPFFKNLIDKICVEDPSQRPTFRDILQNLLDERHRRFESEGFITQENQ